MLTNGQTMIVTNFTQVLTYGIYLATLIQCFRWLLFDDEGWKLRQNINFLMVFVTIFIFSTSTINVVTSLTYELKIYIIKDVSWSSYGTVMMMNISENLALITMDGVLIYRCWVVYAKSWRVVCVPVAVWLASLVCSVLQIYYAGLDWTYHNFELGLIAMKFIIGLYSCQIVTTIYATTAIIYRILSSTRNSLSGGGNHKRLNYTMRILAESGVLYTSMLVFCLIGIAFGNHEDITWVELLIGSLSDIMAFSTGGISFNLILIRVYQSRVELGDSFADSRDNYMLSRNQFQTTSSSEGSPSNMLDEAVDEIQEHRRN